MGIYGVPDETMLPGDFYEGPETGFFENFEAVREQTYRVDSMLGLEQEIGRRWEENLRRYEARTGRKPGFNLSDPLANRMIADRVDGRGFTNWLVRESDPWLEDSIRGDYERANAVDEEIRQIGDPEIKSFDALLQEVMQFRKETEETAAEVSSRRTWGGVLGGLAGGIVGSVSFRDPLTLATLGLGGVGKTVAKRIATEMAVGAATEFGVQELAIQPTRSALGEERSDVLSSVMYAALGAGAIRGIGEGVGAGLRYAGRGAVPEIELDFSDDGLRSMFEAAPESPRARAGLHLLDEDQAFRGANPYGETEIGLRRFEADLASVRAVMSGEPDTAIARVLPESDLPLDLENLSLAVMTVREKTPEIYQRVVDTQARLAELDTNIEQAMNDIDRLDPAEALFRSTRDLPEADRQTGEILRGYRDDLQQPALTAERRADIERKVNQIVESSGGWERVSQLMDEVEITERHNLRSLRASRKAAKKEVVAARKELDKAVERVQVEQRIKELRLGGAPVSQAQRYANTDIPVPDHLRPDGLEARFASVADRALPEQSKLWDEMLKNEGGFKLPERVAAGETVFHGTKEDFPEFDLNMSGQGFGGEKGVFFFTSDEKLAKLYAELAANRTKNFAEAQDTADEFNALHESFSEKLSYREMEVLEDAFPLAEPLSLKELLEVLPEGLVKKIPKKELSRFVELRNDQNIESVAPVNPGVVKSFQLANADLLEVDLKGSIYMPNKYEKALQEAKAAGKDGVKFTNVIDAPFQDEMFEPSTAYALFNPNKFLNKPNKEMFQLANGRIVDGDFEIPNPDNPAASIRIADLLEDLENDEALVAAMRQCAL
jgi:hypothetical protein